MIDDHRDAGQQQREHRLQDEHEPVAEEEAHRLQVDGRARHQLAGLLAVEEAELEALQVAVERSRRSTSIPSEIRPAIIRRE